MSSSPIGFTNSVTSPDLIQVQQLNSANFSSDETVDQALTVDPTKIATAAIAPDIFPAINSSPDQAGYPTDSWRVEVAARLNRYRTRRKPRAPRYPSLLLPFDPSSSWLGPSKDQPKKNGATEDPKESAHHNSANGPFVVTASASTKEANAAATGEGTRRDSLPDQSNLIEFPRFAAIPVFHANTLADPIFDRPRIVEAAEIFPPPPALGGMLIEPVEKEPIDLRANDSPVASASIARRALAALIDGAILAVTMTAMVAIFLYVNPSMNTVRGPLSLLGAALGVLTVMLWVAYEYSFVVYTGSTPGLRIARLRLATFGASPLNRRARKWRVLTSFLSAFSAGLGYLWCLLDQNALCWHDRITRTHLQKANQTSQSQTDN